MEKTNGWERLDAEVGALLYGALAVGVWSLGKARQIPSLSHHLTSRREILVEEGVTQREDVVTQWKEE